MSEHSCRIFLLNTWEISRRLHKYGFVLLNSLRITTNTVFSNPRTASYEFHSKHIFKKIFTCLYSNDWTQNQIPKSCSQKKESWIYLHWLGSCNSNKVKSAYYILTHLMIKNLMIFSCYCTLSDTFINNLKLWLNTGIHTVITHRPGRWPMVYNPKGLNPWIMLRSGILHSKFVANPTRHV